MAYIDIIEPDEASGTLKEIYEDLRKKRGKLAQIHKIQSLNPETIVAHMELYMSIMFSKSPLSRARREMMAVVVSAANECEYCELHHGEALNHYWKNRKKVEQLRKDYTKLDLDNVDARLCRLAQKLTNTPDQIDAKEDVEPLKHTGLSDRAILDAVLVISYFNFVNRMVMGLGVEADEQEVKGYKY
ncbi:peroxidase-related enzyme [Halalkalibaculum sp. DA3122]|uniref:peroxidase-related enzyme n=1 Tax=unclassified Halalkalibaculum TaxID=2964617 RepID=UPI0037544567